MELAILNISGKETGRKVDLNELIFGIEPNDHAIYLDTKQYLANQRQGTTKPKSVVKWQEVQGKLKSKKEPVLHVQETSGIRFIVVEAGFLVQNPDSMASSLIKK